MTMVVVDASAVAAVIFGKPRAGETAAAIDGCNLIAPRLLRFELVSVALKKRLADPEAATGLERCPAMAISERDVPLQPLLDLARETGLSAYDASYLWLARPDGLRLETFDRRLAALA